MSDTETETTNDTAEGTPEPLSAPVSDDGAETTEEQGEGQNCFRLHGLLIIAQSRRVV